jgi:GT2 family glycosyltransferase
MIKSLFLIKEKKYKKQNSYEKDLEEKARKLQLRDFPNVSIIFPSWNGKDETIACLHSLSKLNYPKKKIEIIASDNGSNDGSVQAIKQEFGRMKGWRALKLVENGKNLGAAGAYNTGIKRCEDSKYIWRLDNDVEVDKNALLELVRIGEADSKVGFVGSKIYYFDYDGRKDFLSHAGGYVDLFTGITRHYGQQQYEDGSYNIIKECDFLVGCSYLVRAEIIRRIGLLDERYFIYTEDADWCFKGRKIGYKVIYNYASIVWHKIKNRPEKRVNPFKLLHDGKNRVIFEKRFARFYHWPTFVLYSFVYKSLKSVIVDRNLGYIKGIFKGLIMPS